MRTQSRQSRQQFCVTGRPMMQLSDMKVLMGFVYIL